MCPNSRVFSLCSQTDDLYHGISSFLFSLLLPRLLCQHQSSGPLVPSPLTHHLPRPSFVAPLAKPSPSIFRASYRVPLICPPILPSIPYRLSPPPRLDLQTLFEHVNNKITQVNAWCNCDKLHLNATKSECMGKTYRKIEEFPQLFIGSETVPCVNSFKYLENLNEKN